MKKISICILIVMMLMLSCVAMADPQSKVYGNWIVDEYVDDFGDPTGETYTKTVSTGTFSNTATSGDDLSVVVFYDGSSFLVRLLEYNKTQATYYSNSKIVLKYKVDDVTYTHNLYPNNTPNGDIAISDWFENYAGLRPNMSALQQLTALQQVRSFEDSAYQQIEHFLAAGKDVRCVLTIDSSKYSFTISADGFGECVYGAQYDQAVEAMQSGNYEEAFNILILLGDYKDSAVLLDECVEVLQGPLAVKLGHIQEDGSTTLKEAFAIIKEDPQCQEYLSDTEAVAIIEDLILNEGTYHKLTKSSFDGKTTEDTMSIRYVFVNGMVCAKVSYKTTGMFVRYQMPDYGYVSLAESDYSFAIDIQATSAYSDFPVFVHIEVSPEKATITSDNQGSVDEFTRAQAD